MKKVEKSYFADEYGMFYEAKAYDALEVDFNCLFSGKWNENSVSLHDTTQALHKLQDMGYTIVINDVPQDNAALKWIDEKIRISFVCNDYPTNYIDLSDYWTSIARNTKTYLCKRGETNRSRHIHFSNNWNKIVKIIYENDILIRTKSEYITYDDIDYTQPKENAGVTCDGQTNPDLDFIPVEKMNEKTTALLMKIAVRDSEIRKQYFESRGEQWRAEYFTWYVKKEIADAYGVQIEIEQGSLMYRGTWLTIKVLSAEKTKVQLAETLKQFCADYGFDSKKEIRFTFPYDMPWTDEQKRREKADDDTDWFFDDSMSNDE